MALKKAMELALREEWPPVHLKGVSQLVVESVASKESPLSWYTYIVNVIEEIRELVQSNWHYKFNFVWVRRACG